MGVRAHSSSDRLRTIWTPEMDRYFIDLMLEQVGKGNRIDGHLFSKRAWKHMTSLFNAKFKFHYEKDVLKNRHKTLRNLFKAIKNLLDQEGFSWDETRQMVTADNKVWDEYVKDHPDARSYRIKTVPFYSDLCKIYTNSDIEGKGGLLSCQDTKIDDNAPRLEIVGLLEGPGCLSSPGNDEPGDSLVEALSQSDAKPMVIMTQPSHHLGDAGIGALHDIMIDEDYEISVLKGTVDNIPQQTVDTGSTMGVRSRTYWQPPMDRFFIDLMLEQVQKGNRVDGLFRKQSWMEIISSFNTKFDFNYDIDILKNRYKTLRRQYNVINNLLELDGFAWDDTRQMVTADDRIWQDYIKAHTDARQYMTRPVPYYKDLCIICGESSADERESFSGRSSGHQDEVLGIKFYRSPAASVSSDDKDDEEHESSHMGCNSGVAADQTSKRQLENPSSSGNSKKPRGKDECMASALREMASAVSSLTEKRRDEDSSNTFPIEHVIEAIQALPDMDEELILDACDYLEDEKKAKTFLALDVKLRRKWLVRKLRPLR